MSAGTNESTVAAAPCDRCVSTSVCEEPGRQERRVAGEDEHLVRAGRALSRGAPDRVARAERLLLHGDGRCPSNASAVSGETTTTSGSAPSGRAASTTQSTIRRPRIGCRCFGVAERMRVPRPPAMTTAASLGRDLGHGRHVGWGARIRTWDHGTKTRCLTAWPRPSESGRRVYPDARSRPRPSARVSAGRAGAPPARPPRAATSTDEREHADEHDPDGNEHDDQL